MNSKQIVALAFVAVLALALVPAAAGDSDASTAYVSNDSSYGGFDSMNGGTLTFTVNNRSGGSFTMDVAVYEGSNLVGSTTAAIAAGDSSAQVSVDMGGFTSVGTHTVTVSMSVVSGSNVTLDHTSFTATIVVDQNILNNWVTYAVIIIVAIVIIAFVYLKMRDTPKKQPDMTFEQLEEQRKAEMAAKSEKKSKNSGTSTERQRYLASKNKKE